MSAKDAITKIHEYFQSKLNDKMFNKTNAFDLDLKFGEKFEGCLADILNRGKVEVKTERDIWYDTGNIAIEIRYKNKPSGLSVTKSDYWAQVMTKDDVIKFILLFPVDNAVPSIKFDKPTAVLRPSPLDIFLPESPPIIVL